MTDWATYFSGRVVVISPHLDDAVMSLGATIAKAIEAGAQVEVLTVFAYKPQSSAPVGPWDRLCGYETEGQAATARRAEDQQACRALGAREHWLTYGAEPYERGASDDEIWAAVETATRGANTVLMPGHPLEHPDHAELTRLLLSKGLNARYKGLYAEQPYAYNHRGTPPGPTVPALASSLRAPLSWTRSAANRSHRATKLRAVRSYASQLRYLGLGGSLIGSLRLRYLIWDEARRGGEAIAWLP
jgi:LmbE family N-acetylglucosaminyl deacetylase